jgi:hypothetical protein
MRTEGLTVIDSPVVKELKDEARIEGILKGKVGSLVGVLRAKYSGFPPEVESRIQSSVDPDEVDRWMIAAATAAIIDQFRHDTGL